MHHLPLRRAAGWLGRRGARHGVVQAAGDEVLPVDGVDGEGLMVVAGELVLHLHHDGCVFVADEILAKHDENYMPPEAAKALEDAARTSRGQP